MTAYEQDRSAVLAVLSTVVVGRIRTMATRAFADAFHASKKRDDDPD
jgi:hypothetical protein